jgi:predicted nucleic acid-binding protein
MEAKKIFFDINIVLDIIDISRKNNILAKKLWNLAVINNYEIVISEDMLTTIFYINSDKQYCLNFFDLISKRWNIISFGNKVISSAINLALENNLDLEDTLQCLCAKENECDVFITSDKKFYNCGVEIQNTKEFLQKFAN